MATWLQSQFITKKRYLGMLPKPVMRLKLGSELWTCNVWRSKQMSDLVYTAQARNFREFLPSITFPVPYRARYTVFWHMTRNIPGYGVFEIKLKRQIIVEFKPKRYGFDATVRFIDIKRLPAIISGKLLTATRRFKKQIESTWSPTSNFKSRRAGSGDFSRVSPIRPSPLGRFGSTANYSENHATGVVKDSQQTYISYWRTYTSTRTPGYRTYKAKRLPDNPHTVDLTKTFDGSRFRHRIITGSQPTKEWTVWVEPFTVSYPLSSLPPLVASPQADSKAYQRLLKAADADMNANFAQTFAQFSQVTSMLGTTSRRLRGTLSALRRKDIPGAINVLWNGQKPRFRKGEEPSHTHTLARNWLELQYGWKPLLQDIVEVIGNTQRLFTEFPPQKKVRASATVRSESTFNWASTEIFAPPAVTEMYQQTSVKYGLRYQMDNRLLAFLQQTGFTNPINLAWEILPFSFVVDWLLPIGPYLEALSAWQGMTFVGGYKTTFTKRRILAIADGVLIQVPGASNETTWTTHARWSQERIVLNRVKLTSFPAPTLPAFKNPYSVTHALNALALLRVAFSRR